MSKTTKTPTKPLPKRRVGRPAKTESTDAAAIVKKINEQMLGFQAQCADRLPRYLKVISDAALNDKLNIKDQVQAAKYCIEKAEEFLKETGSTKLNPKPASVDKPKAATPLLSLASKD